MRKIMLLVLTLLVVAGPPGRTATFHECAGVPTDLGGTTFAPSDVVQWDGAAVYTLFFCGLPLGLPPGTVVDAAFMDGGDSGNLVLSFDAPVDLGPLGGPWVEPADLVAFQKTAPGCNGWTYLAVFFDASTVAPPVPTYANVTGADECGADVVLTFDVPTNLGPDHLPGELVSWDGATFASFFLDPGWPIGSRANGFTFLPDPGTVPPTIRLAKSTITPGDIKISWQASPSAASGL